MRSAEGAHSVSGSRVYRATTRFATAWLGHYTRSIDPRYAAERSAAVEFELWEHAIVADRRWSAPHAAALLFVHSIAGMPRDLVWRHAARRDLAPGSVSPVHLLSRRDRHRTWVPLQEKHVFDQTNGVIAPEEALPYERPNDSFGAAGNAFGLQGGF